MSAKSNRAFNVDSGLRVHFYLREEDHRARIVCKVAHSARPSDYFCVPLNLLEVIRVGSCLQLCRRRRSGGELVLWANLKFSTIERMSRLCCLGLADATQGWFYSFVHSLHSARKIVVVRWTVFGIMSSMKRRNCLEGETGTRSLQDTN